MFSLFSIDSRRMWALERNGRIFTPYSRTSIIFTPYAFIEYKCTHVKYWKYKWINLCRWGRSNHCHFIFVPNHLLTIHVLLVSTTAYSFFFGDFDYNRKIIIMKNSFIVICVVSHASEGLEKYRIGSSSELLIHYIHQPALSLCI